MRQKFVTSKYLGPLINNAFVERDFSVPKLMVTTIVRESLNAMEMAKKLTSRESINILDPFCEDGAFLLELLLQLKVKNYTGRISITGWDILPVACQTTMLRLSKENDRQWNGAVNINIVQKDSMLGSWLIGDGYDLVLMNAPSKEYIFLSKTKWLLVKELGNFKIHEPDLVAYYCKKAADCIAPNGALGLLSPHFIIIREKYALLRNYIWHPCGLSRWLVANVSHAGLFEKSKTRSLIIIGVRHVNPMGHTVLWTTGADGNLAAELEQLRIYTENAFFKPVITADFDLYQNNAVTSNQNNHLKFCSYQEYLLWMLLEPLSTVGKLFWINTGAIKKNNISFLLTKHEWLTLPKNEQPYFKPCLMRDAIQNSQLYHSLYLFYPFNTMKIATEQVLQEKLPVYYMLLIISGLLRSDNVKWWELEEPKSFHGGEPKLIFANPGKAGDFAYDLKGKYLVGESMIWQLKGIHLKSQSYNYAYLALMHASFIDTILTLFCESMGMGRFDVSKDNMKLMPMPDLNRAAIGIMSYLAKVGKMIHAGKPFDMEDLNQVVRFAYGLINEDELTVNMISARRFHADNFTDEEIAHDLF